MYGQLTTGKPVRILSRIGPSKPAHLFELAIDTQKNEPVVLKDEEIEWDRPHGTRVEIELEAVYKKGRQSVDDYLEQTALANPHATVLYSPPREADPRVRARRDRAAPRAPRDQAAPVRRRARHADPDAQGHPRGISGRRSKTDFSRVGDGVAEEICKIAGLSPEAQAAPPGFRPRSSGCSTRSPRSRSWRRRPTASRRSARSCSPAASRSASRPTSTPPSRGRRPSTAATRSRSRWGSPTAAACPARSRRAVPLRQPRAAPVPAVRLRDHEGRAVGGLEGRTVSQQARGALPAGPLVVFVHIASVWVPFTSESKEAVATTRRSSRRSGSRSGGRAAARLVRAAPPPRRRRGEEGVLHREVHPAHRRRPAGDPRTFGRQAGSRGRGPQDRARAQPEGLRGPPARYDRFARLRDDFSALPEPADRAVAKGLTRGMHHFLNTISPSSFARMKGSPPVHARSVDSWFGDPGCPLDKLR